MESTMQLKKLTSGSSGRKIPVFRNLRRVILFLHSFILWLLLLLLPPPSPTVSKRRRRDEEDTMRRTALAQALRMVVDEVESNKGEGTRRWDTWLFFEPMRNALFCRNWFPVSHQLSGRYASFARQLNSFNFGFYAMDWIGHGGSDGLHGYVPSLDQVVADTAAFLEKVRSENPGVPCFLYGHSTGGAVILKAASYPHIEKMVDGIILTSPALRVKPAHPIVGVICFSLVNLNQMPEDDDQVVVFLSQRSDGC